MQKNNRRRVLSYFLKLILVIKMYVLKFENMNCFIRIVDDNIGRTLRKDKAEKFNTKDEAEYFKNKCLKMHAYKRDKILIEETN